MRHLKSVLCGLLAALVLLLAAPWVVPVWEGYASWAERTVRPAPAQPAPPLPTPKCPCGLDCNCR